MPYSITWENRAVVFEYSGAVTSRDILLSNQLVYGDERFDRLRWELVFFEKATSVEFSETDVRVIAYMDQGAALSNPRIKVGFVGDTKTLQTVQESYERHSKRMKWSVIRFPTREAAWAAVRHELGAVR